MGKNFPNIKVYYGYDEDSRIHDVIVQLESIWDNTLFEEAVDKFFWNDLTERFESINLAIGFAEPVDIDNILYTNVSEQ